MGAERCIEMSKDNGQQAAESQDGQAGGEGAELKAQALPVIEPGAGLRTVAGLPELLDNLDKRAKVGLATEIKSIDVGGGRRIYFDPLSREVFSKEDFESVVIEPKPQKQTWAAGSLDSLVAMVKSLRRSGRQRPDSVAYVMVTRIGVAVHLDEQFANQCDQIIMGLKSSTSWGQLAKMGAAGTDGGWYTQQQLIDLLSHGMQAAIEPSDLVETVKKITFSHTTAGQGTVDVGKYAISRSVSGEMAGATTLPKSIKATAPVWDNVKDGTEPLTRTIELALVTDPSLGRLRLVPKAGQVELAELSAMEWVCAKLKSELAGIAEVFVGGQ